MTNIGYQNCSKGHSVWLGRPMRKCPVPGCEGLGEGFRDGSAGVREPRRPSPTDGTSEVRRELDGTNL